MPFDAILFDFDGVIVDTETAWYEVWRDTFERHGGRLDVPTYAGCVGTVGLEPEDELAALVGEEALGPLLAQMDAEALERSRALPPRPGITDLLSESDRIGVARAIVTSSHRWWIDEMLASLAMTDGWATIACADGDRSIAKPDPHLYRVALADLGVDPTRAVVLEDSPNGIRAAKAADIPCVAVPNPITASLDLSAADALLPSLQGVGLAALRAALS